MLTTPTLSIMASLQYLVLIRLSVIPEKSLPIKYQNGQAHHMIKMNRILFRLIKDIVFLKTFYAKNNLISLQS